MTDTTGSAGQLRAIRAIAAAIDEVAMIAISVEEQSGPISEIARNLRQTSISTRGAAINIGDRLVRQSGLLSARPARSSPT